MRAQPLRQRQAALAARLLPFTLMTIAVGRVRALSTSAPDIFISYAREDVEWVRELAAELGRVGYSVFWDQRIPIGETWHRHIGTALETARRVIAVWSQASVGSQWVLEEAGHGKERGVLLPVRKDAVRPPLGFRQIETADLSAWQPGEASHELARLLQDLSRVLLVTKQIEVSSVTKPNQFQSSTLREFFACVIFHVEVDEEFCGKLCSDLVAHGIQCATYAQSHPPVAPTVYRQLPSVARFLYGSRLTDFISNDHKLALIISRGLAAKEWYGHVFEDIAAAEKRLESQILIAVLVDEAFAETSDLARYVVRAHCPIVDFSMSRGNSRYSRTLRELLTELRRPVHSTSA